MSAENTCTFNKNTLFKKFKEKLAVTPGAILHAYLHRFMRKWKLLSSTPGCGLLTSSHGGHQKCQWEGGPRGGNFQGGGTDSQGLFFQGL